jgi:hypothetical protein
MCSDCIFVARDGLTANHSARADGAGSLAFHLPCPI